MRCAESEQHRFVFVLPGCFQLFGGKLHDWIVFWIALWGAMGMVACSEAESGGFPNLSGANQDTFASSGGCPSSCLEVPEVGYCNGNTFVSCPGNAPICKDCTLTAQVCVHDDVKKTFGCRAKNFQNPPCVPNCTGRHCGPDGCGGSCGFCPDTGACDGTTCRLVGTPCGDVGAQHGCFGNIWATCLENSLQLSDCTPKGQLCGYNASSESYTCMFPEP